MQSGKKPTALERMALNMVENFIRSSLGKSPDELRAVFEATIANLNGAALSIIAINERLARIDARLSAIENLHAEFYMLFTSGNGTGKHPRSAADATIGRLANGDDRPSAVHGVTGNRPGSAILGASSVDDPGSSDGTAS